MRMNPDMDDDEKGWVHFDLFLLTLGYSRVCKQ